MNLYPEMAAQDLISHAALMAEIVRQNYRLKASFPDDGSWLYMEIRNTNTPPNKTTSVCYIATVVVGHSTWFRTEKKNPIEAVDEVMQKAGITTVQQYIDLKTLTESLSKGAAQ